MMHALLHNLYVEGLTSVEVAIMILFWFLTKKRICRKLQCSIVCVKAQCRICPPENNFAVDLHFPQKLSFLFFLFLQPELNYSASTEKNWSTGKWRIACCEFEYVYSTPNSDKSLLSKIFCKLFSSSIGKVLLSETRKILTISCVSKKGAMPQVAYPRKIKNPWSFWLPL